MKKVELLAPAGSLETCIGALNAGADAVYLAGKRFGARANAANLSMEEIEHAVRFAHLRNKKIFITVNTIIFDDELSSFLTYTDELVNLHVDALIVQDYGMMNELRHRYPNTEIHISTQMNTLNLSQVKYLEKLGVNRIVLARETSIDDIKRFREETSIDFEVFGHGALCISYSGNCYLSFFNGTRSGNRGECAGACRLPYQMLKNGELFKDDSYILSTKDLMTLPYLEEFIDAGISSLKIEGRMRSKEYIVETIKTYRKYIDLIYLNKTDHSLEEDIKTLKTVFNRDYTKGYILNEKPYDLTQTKQPNHKGIVIGSVIDFHYGKATLKLSDELSVGDGIRIVGDKEHGTIVSRILKNNESILVASAKEIVVIDLRESVSVGSKVMKTSSKELSVDTDIYLNEQYKSIPLNIRLIAKIGDFLELELSSEWTHVSTVSTYQVEAAKKQPLDDESIIKQLSKLGDTPYFLDEVEIIRDEFIFIPNIVLNEIRRDSLLAFEEERLKRNYPVVLNYSSNSPKTHEEPLSLLVKVETLEQLQVALSFDIKKIIVPYGMDISNYKNEKVEWIRSFPRIEDKDDIAESSVLIHDLGDLLYSEKKTIYSSPYLNVINKETLIFLYQQGITNITLSFESSAKTIESLITSFYKEQGFYPSLTIMGYGRMDAMIMKYCPITKAENINQRNCFICMRNQYALKDHKNHEYPLVREGECNIRMLDYTSRSRINELSWMKRNHISYVRLDFTLESKAECKQIIYDFKEALKTV